MIDVPFALGWGGMAVLFAGAFIAGYARGYSGFGASALFLTAAALVVSPLPVVAVAMSLEIIATIWQARGIRADVDKRRVGLLLGGALAGLPLGVVVLKLVDVDMLRAGISVFVLAMCILLLMGMNSARPAGAAGTAGVGILSGFANAASVGGLPVAVFLAAQPVKARGFRADIIAYLFVINLVAIPLIAFAGMVTRDSFLTLAWMLPVFLLALWLGSRKFTAASPESFRKFAISLLMVLAVLGLAKAAF